MKKNGIRRNAVQGVLTVRCLMVLLLTSVVTGTVWSQESWRAFYDVALEAYMADDYAVALPAYEEAVQQGCRDGKAWYQYGYSREMLIGLDDDTRRVYSIAEFYLRTQYPTHDYATWVTSKVDDSLVVTDAYVERFVNGTTTASGAEAARDRGWEPFRAFLGRLNWVGIAVVVALIAVTLYLSLRPYRYRSTGRWVRAVAIPVGGVGLVISVLFFFVLPAGLVTEIVTRGTSSVLDATVARGLSVDAAQGGSADRWAICVGINDYEDSSISDLAKAENDAEAVAAGLSYYGQFDQVILMQGGDNPRDPSYPRLRNIDTQLEVLGEFIEPDDFVVFFFSGHGVADAAGENYLVAVDTDSEDLFDTSLPVSRVVEWVEGLGVRKSLLMIDACRETIVQSRSVNLRSLDSAVYDDAELAAVFFATRSGWYSYEDPESDYGVFTRFVIEGLKGAADQTEVAGNADGLVTFAEMSAFVQSGVSDWSLRNQKRQRPYTRVIGERFGDLVLASYDTSDFQAAASRVSRRSEDRTVNAPSTPTQDAAPATPSESTGFEGAAETPAQRRAVFTRPTGGISIFGTRYFGTNQLCFGRAQDDGYVVLHDNGSQEYGVILPSPDDARVIFGAREGYRTTYYLIGTDGRNLLDLEADVVTALVNWRGGDSWDWDVDGETYFWIDSDTFGVKVAYDGWDEDSVGYVQFDVDRFNRVGNVRTY